MPRADWVYRTNLRDDTGAVIDGLATYSNNPQVMAGTDSGAAVLYDSHNFSQNAAVNFTGVPTLLASAARAEGGRAKVIRVQGMMHIRPSAWALGNRIIFGCRFGIFEQDPSVGAFLIDPSYSMFAEPANPQFSSAEWANDRQWHHERRFYTTFSDGQQDFLLRFNFPVNRRLQPNMCYGIYTEQLASVTVSVTHWFRTLVSDEA